MDNFPVIRTEAFSSGTLTWSGWLLPRLGTQLPSWILVPGVSVFLLLGLPSCVDGAHPSVAFRERMHERYDFCYLAMWYHCFDILLSFPTWLLLVWLDLEMELKTISFLVCLWKQALSTAKSCCPCAGTLGVRGGEGFSFYYITFCTTWFLKTICRHGFIKLKEKDIRK